MALAIGIDLGTTFSAVSYINENGKPEILKDSFGNSLIPSVIYFNENGETVVGTEAKEEQAFGKENIASFFKRNMGDENFQLSFHSKTYNATDLSSILLEALKNKAESILGQKIDSAVITVPAYFNDLQKKSTIIAAERAGIKVLRIINEPTSAAIAYGVSFSGNQTILVYDLGGGTFDVTILRIDSDSIKVLATGGDHELGGKDWDDRLINYVSNQFNEEFGVDPLSNSVYYNDLLVRGEDAKKMLSSSNRAKFTLVYDCNRGSCEITREKFEEITSDLLQKTTSKVEQILDEVDLNWSDIDGVLLVGGSTRMPMIAEWVKQTTRNTPLKGLNIDEAVCLGAAVQAGIELNSLGQQKYTLAGRISKIEDVISHSLGLIAENSDRSRYIQFYNYS